MWKNPPLKSMSCNLAGRRFGMLPVKDLECPSGNNQQIFPLIRGFFPDLLRAEQNTDGGWGYRSGTQSAVESTAWATLALQPLEPPDSRILSSASEWLRRAQTTAGAWPTGSGSEPGCWVTALACLALLSQPVRDDDAVARGARWLCSTWPAEGNLMWRLRKRLHREQENVVRQDDSLRGWSWTPGTASWVEPTAYSLLLLQNMPDRIRPSQAGERIQLAERMLYDRACPEGGWNTGNPLVYGVPGVPRIGPTVWALLALRNHRDHPASAEGIEWLARTLRSIKSPGSLALAHLCLQVYGREPAPVDADLCNLYKKNQFLQSIPVVAWASLALNGVPTWLEPSSEARSAI